jgi:hypothetical protein
MHGRGLGPGSCPDDQLNIDAVVEEVGRSPNSADTVSTDQLSFNFAKIE